MKIVVIGGTGLIGAKVVTLLRLGNHEVISASPSTGVSTITGEGLAEALSGAEIVVDVSNSPSLKKNAALAFFEISGRNLLAAEAAAGVRHHVTLSVVGTNRLPESGYFRAKMAQENLVRASNAPFTILRSSPFFEYINGIVEADAEGDTLRVSPAYVQPIAADDVALALRDVVLGRAQNEEIEVVGPDSFRLSDLARTILAANEDPRFVIADPEALYFGVVLRDDTLMPGDHPRFAPTRFEDWLRRAIAETLTPAF
ncbi:LysR family transcriptional regulator [Labrys miyagiensis]|uniref:LysR family transcriptional regulator n=1 Tax=Labrys miyagiensis TaxID=346912 RepID=A0ABQ6CT37_9HYPH|nr:SDR family oxidoreductase [Labrys miyagiensis]GLS22935.1 LysR family transcriptional regulator [Labrys miyagiensis]